MESVKYNHLNEHKKLEDTLPNGRRAVGRPFTEYGLLLVAEIRFNGFRLSSELK